MLFLYTCFCIVIVSLSIMYTKRILNPVTIYSLVWEFSFFMHECGLLNFDKISYKTFGIIICAHFSFFVGAMVGGIKKKVGNVKIRIELSEEKRHIRMKKTLFWLSFIYAFNIGPVFYQKNLSRGFNLITNFSDMYKTQLYTTESSGFSFTNFIFIIAFLLGLYVLKYGFDKFLIISVIDILLFGMSNGSRGSLIVLMSIFIAPITIGFKIEEIWAERLKKNKKMIGLIFFILVLVVLIITVARSKGSSNGRNPILQFIVVYFGSGIGVLDKFLENPEIVHFPQYTFRVLYLLTNAIGLTKVDIFYWVPTYHIPFTSNVYTYIGELYHDFGNMFWIGSFVIGYLSGFFYKNAINNDSTAYVSLYSSFFAIIALSFFANFIHVASIWYVLVVGTIISFMIDASPFSIIWHRKS